jgi:NADH-quinone oxidoreductase subunit A
MYADFAIILVFVLLGVAFVAGALIVGAFVRPRKGGEEKLTVYECGEPTIGSTWIRFNSRFYTVALVYLLFDVEVVVLVPTMLVLRELKTSSVGVYAALIGLLVFVALLVLGLAYEWFYGNLDWIGQREEAVLGAQEGQAAGGAGGQEHV